MKYKQQNKLMQELEHKLSIVNGIAYRQMQHIEQLNKQLQKKTSSIITLCNQDILNLQQNKSLIVEDLIGNRTLIEMLDIKKIQGE